MDAAAAGKGYAVPSTAIRTDLRLMKWTDGDSAKELLPVPLCSRRSSAIENKGHYAKKLQEAF